MTTAGSLATGTESGGGDDGSPAHRGAALSGAGALVVAAVGYVVVEAVVAAAWTDPPYGYLANLVPSLGNTSCGPWQGQVICSPRHGLMNAVFIVHGVLVALGGIALSRLAAGRTRRAVAVLSVVYAVGLSAITVFHQHAGMSVPARALNITGAFVAILAASAVAVLVGPRWRRLGLPRWWGVAGITAGVLATVSAVALFAFSIGPVGVRERVPIYLVLAWQLLTGLVLVGYARRGRSGS